MSTIIERRKKENLKINISSEVHLKLRVLASIGRTKKYTRSLSTTKKESFLPRLMKKSWRKKVRKVKMLRNLEKFSPGKPSQKKLTALSLTAAVINIMAG